MSEFYFWYMKSMPNRSGLVQKDVTVTREGTTFTRRQWVRPDEAESTQKFTKEELAKIYHEFTSNSVDGHTYACRALKESGFHWEESPSPSENWRRAKAALEHTIDLVFFPNGDKSISSGGQNKFDIETAKKEYLKYLTNVPEKNRIWLEYYSKNTKYVMDTNLNGPFAYSMKKDVIIFNPTSKDFGQFDFIDINTHELSHRMDALYFHSWENNKFKKEVFNAGNEVMNHLNTYTMLCKQENVLDNPFFSDIISALSEDQLRGTTGHEKVYWRNIEIKCAEIFANLFSLESMSAVKQLNFLNQYLDKMYLAYLSIFK